MPTLTEKIDSRSWITGDIVAISKKGREYPRVRYVDAEDAVAKALVKKSQAVYVERVHEEGDFSSLGIEA